MSERDSIILKPSRLTRVILDQPPFANRRASNPWDGAGPWAASWICLPEVRTAPFVAAYRLRFRLNEPTALRVHVTADERYELFLDGARVGRGSERGDVLHWFFESYEGRLEAGAHVLVARVWTLGEQAPYAQISTAPGFLLAADTSELSELLDTGKANWEVKALRGYTFQSPLAAWGTGANVVIDGEQFDWGFDTGEGEGWQAAKILRPATDDPCFNTSSQNPLLTPATLPPMLDQAITTGIVRHVAAVPAGPVSKIQIRQADHLADEAENWQRFVQGAAPWIIPAHTRRRVIVDLAQYYCAYHHLEVSGGKGAHVELHWQESLYDTAEAKTKGNRDAIEGKYFITTWHLKDGIGDRFETDGGAHRRYESLWWHCGRYVQILIETAGEPLTLHRLAFQETRYPLERSARFSSSNPAMNTIVPLAWRALQVCAHETYFDCPYFEQLQYIGDARIESLVTFVSTLDQRLPRKAAQIFDWSRSANGLTQSRYPSGIRQIIPAFSLLWIGMVHDYFMWRGDPKATRELLPGIRSVLEYWLLHVSGDGAIIGIPGWNYLDWTPDWQVGVPPGGSSGGGASFSFLLQISLLHAAEMEDQVGVAENAQRWRRTASALAAAARDRYWVEHRGLYADDEGRTHFSEHAQALGVLAGGFSEAEKENLITTLTDSNGLTRTTIYFSHYFFEALRQLHQPSLLIDRLDLWLTLHQLGLKTTVEMPEPTRSDCHAWSSHPLFHYGATLLGIRPASWGFATVSIAPQLGTLQWIQGSMPHLLGEIQVRVQRNRHGIEATVTLPDGLHGTFEYAGKQRPLVAGTQTLVLNTA
ncbi:MAG TPA: alpha-L-rhamnosidase C-terminal domain-containing protein [Opitutaceae bacterium]|nr:alpha-L-rhamnosidase C-terminal domain-containing protein [Opitutaceae bacterium]